MLWDCQFLLPSGRRFTPFAKAPWADDPSLNPNLPAHLRHLAGEFVCVPFGIGGRPQGLLLEWDSDSWMRVNPQPHGLSSDAAWDLLASDAHHVSLRLDYPATSDIQFLTRRVSADPGAPALDLELEIRARRPTRLPIGLHPILRLPDPPAELIIEAAFEFGMTYPALTPPGITRLALGKKFSRLDAIPGARGDYVDYSRLPKEAPTEEMLMLCRVESPVTVRYPAENVEFHLSWDTKILPSCLLWPSDRSIAEPPWNGRFRGLGLEPIAALFDSAREVALENNPIAAMGVATWIEVMPDRPLIIRYRIEAEDA
jgi:hypothetical protein